MKFLLLLTLFVTMFTRDSLSNEKETVTWLKWDQAPNFIFKGKYKDQGVGDHMMKTLIKGLPQYKHTVITPMGNGLL